MDDFQPKRVECASSDFVFLIGNLDNELKERYGAVQSEFDIFNKVEKIKTGIVGYVNNSPVACGCFKNFDERSVEIKRMFVSRDFRRKGYSSEILSELEKWAVELGYEKSLIETGEKQPEAINMYVKAGYERIPNFGQYKDIPQSICLGKWIKEV